MTIDIRNERAIPLTKSPKYFPGKPHVSTVFRWALRADDRRLETFKCGGRRFTTIEAIERFIARCSANDKTQPPISHARRRQVARAEAELEAAGIS